MATAEAADVLAMLHMGAARGAGFQPAEREQSLKQAKRAVDFGLATIKYVDLKTDYTETLLLRRLKSHIASPEAEQAYHAAEKLRQKKKFAEAGKAFHELCQKFPESEWAAPATFRIGQCYLELDHPKQALRHWQKFIEDAPEGPWRGQARVAIIDVALKQNLDLATASEHALAATSVVVSLRETKPHAEHEDYTSWQQASYDIHLRQGIVSLAEGRYEAAAQAFRESQASLETSGRRPEANANLQPKAYSLKPLSPLSRLLEAAQAQSPLLPRELQVGEAKTIAALTLGNIYLALHDFSSAKRLFNFPLAIKTRSSSAPHRSFALFGVAHAMRNLPNESPLKRFENAVASYHLSLEEFPKGSWHDETLYYLATITQDIGEEKFGEALRSTAAKTADGKAEPQPSTKWQLNLSIAAKGKALPYWRELIARYPDSPRTEQAFYSAAILLCELSDGSTSGKAEAMWTEAAGLLKRFCERHPQSVYTGDAHVRLIDIALERMFDLKLAKKSSEKAIAWADQDDGEKTRALSTAELWCTASSQFDTAALAAATYDCYLRAGLVAYLSGDKDAAIAMFRKADRAGDASRKRLGAETAMERMIAVVQGSRDQLTPQQLLEAIKNDKQKTALVMADVALLTFDPDRAGALYMRLLAGAPPFPKPAPNVESYLLLRMGQVLEYQKKHDEAMACLKLLYNPKYKKFPWTADGIFRVGTWTKNATQDPKSGMQHWEHIFTNFPKHPEAERSLFYYGLNAMRGKDYQKAASAFSEYLKRYPDSRWTERIKNELLPEVMKLSRKDFQ